MNKIPEYFYYLVAFGLAWTLGVGVFMAVRRRNRGLTILRPHFDNVLFLETWRSGRSLRSKFSILVPAQNCLWVAVTFEALRVGLHFPFNVMVGSQWLGLEKTISPSAIQWAVPSHGMLGPKCVKICFINDEGNEEELEINLKQYDKFLEATASIKGLK